VRRPTHRHTHARTHTHTHTHTGTGTRTCIRTHTQAQARGSCALWPAHKRSPCSRAPALQQCARVGRGGGWDRLFRHGLQQRRAPAAGHDRYVHRGAGPMHRHSLVAVARAQICTCTRCCRRWVRWVGSSTRARTMRGWCRSPRPSRPTRRGAHSSVRRSRQGVPQTTHERARAVHAHVWAWEGGSGPAPPCVFVRSASHT
jgi:hypothetical protein